MANSTEDWWLPEYYALCKIGVEFLEAAGLEVADLYANCYHKHLRNIDGTNKLCFPQGQIRTKANRVRQNLRRSKQRGYNWETPTFSEELYNFLDQNDVIDRLYRIANGQPPLQPTPTHAEDTTMSNNNNNNNNNNRTGVQFREGLTFDNQQGYRGDGDGVGDLTQRMRGTSIRKQSKWYEGPLKKIQLTLGVSETVKGLTITVGPGRITDDGGGKKKTFTVTQEMVSWEDRFLVSATNDIFSFYFVLSLTHQ